MNILFTVFTALTMMGLVAGDALDDFRAYGNGGRCYSTGCSSGKTCPKFCYGFIGTLEFLQVDDNGGEDFDLGVKNCAEACAGYGKKEGLPENEAAWSPRDQYQGEFVCNSFDYRPTKDTNCYLHQNPARGTQGSNPGSTRVDYTQDYCFTRDGNDVGKLPCKSTASPTVAPTVTPCQDDENWTFEKSNGKEKSCRYVAKNPNNNRCSKLGAAEACCACKP